MSIAAILVISVGMYFSYTYKRAYSNIDLADVSPAFGRKEVRFTSLIEERRDSLEVYAKQCPDLCNKFIDDLDKLNKDYDMLKKQLQTSPNKQAVVRAIMKNLELQLQVVDQQLNIVNQVNQYKKENSI